MIPRRSLCARLLVVCLLFVTPFVFVSLISAQKDSSSSDQSSGSLRVVTLTTARGDVKVSLPDDIRAGDTISGIVTAAPKGKDPTERKENHERLMRETIEIDTQRWKVADGEIHLSIPASAKDLRITLTDEQGKRLTEAVVGLVSSAELLGKSQNPSFPQLGQAGRPYAVSGVFDGNSANTNVVIGGTPAKVLAESPRQVIVESPRDAAGPTNVEVKENGASTTGSFRNLKIDLTAPKTSLLKGESTELHVEVQGLQGITQPVQVQVQNQSPSNINLAGGNTQNIIIQPGQVPSSGTFNWSTTVTGTGSGGFEVTGSLPATPSPAPTATPTPAPAPSPQVSTPQVSPAPPRTGVQVSPVPAPAGSPEATFTRADTDCCKRFLKDGVFSLSDDKGNGVTIFRNKLTMKIGGKEYEWEFTQDGKPFYIEWMFCHLNDDQIISQTSQVMVQRVKGGNLNESGSTTSISLHGPYRSVKSRRPAYGFQFGSQKIGTDTEEYSVSFSMDAEFCTWTCQLMAEGEDEEFRTDPPRGPHKIYNGLNQSTGLPSGATAYQQQAWWNGMYSYFFEIEDWLLWINNNEGSDLDETYRAYNAWRTKVVNALGQMSKTAAPQDRGRINAMLRLLENTKPSLEEIQQIQKKFDELHLRYGTPVPPEARKQILYH